MAKNLLTDQFSELLHGTTSAIVDIHVRDGNLTIDRLLSDEGALASGMLEYFEEQGLPSRSLVSRDGQATLILRGGSAGKHWFHLPWSACNGATEWQIHLNPTVPCDITAHSGGGNVHLDLSEMEVTHLTAGTGGGNIDLVLPEGAANLGASVETGAGNITVEIGRVIGKNTLNASSGAGNVIVHIPNGIQAQIHATSGLGKVIVDPEFACMQDKTYQSPDFDGAVDQVKIILSSGMGNVNVITR